MRAASPSLARADDPMHGVQYIQTTKHTEYFFFYFVKWRPTMNLINRKGCNVTAAWIGESKIVHF
jgi:hypothetical protein